MNILVTVIVPNSTPKRAVDLTVQAAQAYLEVHGPMTCDRIGSFEQRNAEGVQHLIIWKPQDAELTRDAVDLKDLESIMKKALHALRIEDVTVRVSISVEQAA